MPTTTITNHNQGTLAILRGLMPSRSLLADEGLRIAELQATMLRRLLGVHGPTFPTEALDLPRVHISFDPDLPTSGMTFWDGSNWMILINAGEAPTRQRFSLLHEFKHIIDHPIRHRLFGADAAQDAPAAERSADYFAACALMPKLHVKRHWGQGPRTIRAMTRIFHVSPAAMKYRLDQLGLSHASPRCGRGHTTQHRTDPPTLEMTA